MLKLHSTVSFPLIGKPSASPPSLSGLSGTCISLKTSSLHGMINRLAPESKMTGNQSIISPEQFMKELTSLSLIALYPWGEIKSKVSTSRNLHSTSVDGVTILSNLKKFVVEKLFGFVGVLLDVMMTGLVNSCRKFCN